MLDASVTSLLRAFQSALRALLPPAEQSRLAWRDGESGPDWEKLSSSVFDAFVRAPIGVDRARVRDTFPLARYDIDVPDYAELSWIACRFGGDDLAIVRLLSVSEPFDTVQAVRVGPDLRASDDRVLVPFSEAEFEYARHTRHGGLTRIARIVAVE